MEDSKNPKKPGRKPRYIATTGRRKSSVAQVRLTKGGSGEVIINNKPLSVYFPDTHSQAVLLKPLELTGTKGLVDLSIIVKGGGKVGQLDACRHGISRALLELDEATRKTLKPEGMLTRDSRQKERKKPGLRKARRAPQFSKR